jgi:DNA-binding PadR family transcriptional regulator
MNSLAFALLAMLARKDCTGYELTKLLELFWQAKHSQIYPLLAKLEREEYVMHTYVVQKKKPDKKIYRITEKGKERLSEWIGKDPAEPVHRDEFLTKVYAIWLTDHSRAKELFRQRIAFFEQKLERLNQKIDEMEQEIDGSPLHMGTPFFGRYVIYIRKRDLSEEEIRWCRWVVSLLEHKNRTNRA